MNKTSFFIFLGLVSMLYSASSYAWEVTCSVDDFTDEEHCFIRVIERGQMMFIGHTDDKKRMVISSGDGSTLYTDEFLIRVDSNDARDLEATGMVSSRNRGHVAVILDNQDANDVIEEMAGGEEIRIRLNPFSGTRQAATFTAEGLSDAWAEFRERTAQ